jgi:hypothetical protein
MSTMGEFPDWDRRRFMHESHPGSAMRLTSQIALLL